MHTSTSPRRALLAAAACAALLLGACSKDRTMMVMVRDASTKGIVADAAVNLRTTQGTSTSRFARAATITGDDGSILIAAPVREALQITVETPDGSYGRFVIDHPALGMPTPWRTPGAIGYEYGPRRFELSAIEWEGGKPERSPSVPWKEPTPYRPGSD